MAQQSDFSERALEVFAQGLAYGFTPSAAAIGADLRVTDVEAAHLSTDSRVTVRVQELLKHQIFDPSLEHLRVARQLEVDRDFAYKMGNPASAVNATVQRAKVLGIYVERVVHDQNVALSTPESLTPDEWKIKFGSKEAP